MNIKKFLTDNKGCPLTTPAIKQLLVKFIEMLGDSDISTLIDYISSGSSDNTFIQKVGNPEDLETPPEENVASQLWASTFGKSNKSTNYASFTTGTRNENNADSAFVTGVGNKTTFYGMCSLTFGEGNVNASRDSLVGGYYNISASDIEGNLVVGTLLQANNDNQHVIGTANELKTDLRFAIGNGTYAIDPETYEPVNVIRKNAFEVYKNGDIRIPEGKIYVYGGLMDANGTKRFEVNTSGQAIFTAHILPDNNNTRTVGTSQKTYKEVYTRLLKDDLNNSVLLSDLQALVTYAKSQGWIS